MATAPVEPSCLECPSYLAPAQAAAFIGKSTGAPMCARYGSVLGRPGVSDKQANLTLVNIAKRCDSFGYGRPSSAPILGATEVALPDPALRTELSPLDSKRSMVKACHQCTKFIPDEVVAEATGWAAGACAAKGRLILGNKRRDEAASCNFRQAGKPLQVFDLPLMPIYVGADAADAAAMERAADSIIEPLDYPTDREVTDEEAELGILAWRKVADPEADTFFVMIPIFDPKSFTDEERELIPQTGEDAHPELYFDHNGALYQIAALWMEMDETPAAWGQPGVGKTEVYRHLAWLMQVPFYRFSIKESTELYELEGAKEYDPEKGTWFREGRFTVAWRSRCVVVVDEPNMGRPEVWAFLRPCMDNSKQLVIDSDGGRHVPRNPFAFLGLAMNPAWSPLNVGTNPIGLADASRLMHVDFGLPEEPVERKIISNRVKLDGWKIDDARLDLIMKVSTMVRELCESGALSLSWGIRENIKVARAMKLFDPIRAYRMGAANYLEPSQRDTFLDQVRSSYIAGSLPKVKMLDEGN